MTSYLVGQIRLDTDARSLVGPRGHVTLARRPYAVLERLMRRPGVLVSTSDLIAAMYPDDEPDSAQNQLRQIVKLVRSLMAALGSDGLSGAYIRTEPSIGYAISTRHAFTQPPQAANDEESITCRS